MYVVRVAWSLGEDGDMPRTYWLMMTMCMCNGSEKGQLPDGTVPPVWVVAAAGAAALVPESLCRRYNLCTYAQ